MYSIYKCILCNERKTGRKHEKDLEGNLGRSKFLERKTASMVIERKEEVA